MVLEHARALGGIGRFIHVKCPLPLLFSLSDARIVETGEICRWNIFYHQGLKSQGTRNSRGDSGLLINDGSVKGIGK